MINDQIIELQNFNIIQNRVILLGFLVGVGFIFLTVISIII
jgi:hypothetical protein